MTGEGIDQEALLERVLREHRDSPHPGLTPERMRLHASLHVVVETQVLTGDPPETSRTLARLVDSGLDRHQAVHAVASVVADEMMAIVSARKKFDQDRFEQQLRALDPADWRDELRLPGS